MKRLFKFILCMFKGHVPFNAAAELPVYIQPKKVGNQVMSLHLCSRCELPYLEKSELSKEALAAEAAYEAKQQELMEQIRQQTEELIKRNTELKINKEGKIALN